ncbi:4-fold beta flower protein [Bradyrhizobium oligotrophicum]|uniref:4-fold beta flower protein n=1 Tax=Bradyrhizobium oligotrophicum TaxID=44255 RepID=UPI003EBE47BD
MNRVFISFLFLSFAGPAIAEEISLFNAQGAATAYIDTDDDLTIYLWSGKPVAYLDDGNVYGFNGKHLGWFERGAIWGEDGGAACATAAAMPRTQFEPFKSFKQFKPFKSFKEFAPLKPLLSGRFGSMPCAVLLAAGGS